MKILYVDVNNIFHRSYRPLINLYPDMVDSKGLPCTGTYGFFTSFFKAFKYIRGYDGYFFTCDCRGSNSVRKEVDPNYKSSRKDNTELFHNDLNNLVDNYLPMLGIHPYSRIGYEADDLMACGIKFLTSEAKDAEHIIMSGDSDTELFTNYSKNIKIIKTQPNWHILDYSAIMKKWRVETPQDIYTLKAIIGDRSDDIKGIMGINKKEALKMYQDEYFLREHNQQITKNLKLINFRDDLKLLPQTADLGFQNLKRVFNALKSAPLLSKLKTLSDLCS